MADASISTGSATSVGNQSTTGAAQSASGGDGAGLTVAAVLLRWDPDPFILLNLAFSTPAAYAAPLILLAQNRQDERDRAQAERDREVNFRTQAEAEFLARELASVRLSLNDVATVDDLREAIGSLTEAMARIESKLDER